MKSETTKDRQCLFLKKIIQGLTFSILFKIAENIDFKTFVATTSFQFRPASTFAGEGTHH